MSNFAPPASKLAESGIGNAAAPTGGMGLVLDDKGFVPESALHGAKHYIGQPGEPGFEGAWVNFTTFPTRAAHFWKDAAGVVHLGGLISTGTVNTTAFTLPLGYRHEEGANVRFAVVSNDLFGAVYIATSGAVVPYVGSNVFFDLAGIHFLATA